MTKQFTELTQWDAISVFCKTISKIVFMKKIFLLFNFAAVSFIYIHAQCPTNITFSTQAQIDAFPSDYPGCTELLGKDTISGADITNLNGLSQITTVEDGLVITNNNLLQNLIGLDNLISVHGSFKIFDNPNLISLTGLENLTTIAGNSQISGNRIKDLIPLANLSNIGFGLTIGPMDSLLSLTGLSSLTSITGGLNIVGNNSLVNMSGLELLTSVGGMLSIKSNNLMEDLTGLDNLTNVGGLHFWYNPVLTSLHGLEQLTYIHEDLDFTGNEVQTSMDGLNSLSYIGGDVYLSDMDALTSFNGLENLDTIGGILSGVGMNELSDVTALSGLNFLLGLIFAGNTALTSLNGFEGLDSLLYISIKGCNNLTNLTGLDNVTYLDFFLSIEDNVNLTSLSGLDNLQFIGNLLKIDGNPVLYDLAGLSQLAYIGQELKIENNPNLQTCSYIGICNFLATPTIPPMEEAIIQNNALGCDTKEEVEAVCNNSFSTVNGKIFADLNCNDIVDGIDVTLPYHILRRTDDFPFSFTDLNGSYNHFLLPSTSTDYKTDTYPGYSVVPNIQTVTTELVPQSYSDYDFQFCPDSLFHNLGVTLVSYNPPVPGFSQQFQLCVTNYGTFLEDASLTFEFLYEDGAIPFTTIQDSDGGLINDQTVSWSLDDLPLFTPICFTLTALISETTPTFIISRSRATIATSNGEMETTLSDNSDALNEVVFDSFDPNDKTVDQPEIEYSEFEEGITLEYQIRFQNTGSAPASFVEILDTLESNLDIRTFKMITASHPYTLSFPADNILKWRFDNINLPDSASNELESHGFVKFSINTVPGLSLTDVVSNTASIYFDFNEPVITNTATTSFFVGVKEVPQQNTLKIAAFPNPTDGFTRLEFTMQEASVCRIEVINLQGIVFEYFELGFQDAGDHSFPLDVSSLASGVYQVRVIAGIETGFVKLVSTE
jgi:hypothetical protein